MFNCLLLPGYDVKLCPAVLPLLLSVGRLVDRKGIRSIKKILLQNLDSEWRFRVPPAASSFSERRFRVPPAASSFRERHFRMPPAASSFSERRFRLPPAASSFSELRFRVTPAASTFNERSS